MKPVILYSLFILMQTKFIFGSPLLVHYKCWLWDSTCLTAKAQASVPIATAGFPELGVGPLDPMAIESMHAEQDGFIVDMKSFYVHGLRNALIEKLSVDFDLKLIRLMFYANYSVVGPYTADGAIFSSPIKGDGEASFKIGKTQMELICPFEIVKDLSGKTVMDLKSCQYWYDVKDDSSFYLDNLFDGNQELSLKMHVLLNRNAMMIMKKYGRYMFDLITDKIFHAIRTYLHLRPLDTAPNTVDTVSLVYNSPQRY